MCPARATDPSSVSENSFEVLEMSLTTRILTVDSPVKASQVARLPQRCIVDAGSGELAYRLTWRVCQSPTCPCSTIVAQAMPETVAMPETAAPDESSAPEGESFEVIVDTFTSSLLERETADPRAIALAEAWSEKDWHGISNTFFRTKQEQAETVDLSKLGAGIKFPVEEVQEQGTLVGWYDVVPFDRSLQVELDGEMFLIDDQYCVKKGCGCHNAVLTFTSAMPSSGEDKEDAVADMSEGAMSAIDLDLRTAEWKVRRVEKGAPATELMELTMKITGIRALLRRRRKDLRAMYRNHLKAIDYKPSPILPRSVAAPASNSPGATGGPVPGPMLPTAKPATGAASVASVASVASAKPGRNDPCHCGSGKKFKKCCLRA